jgi:hypothetical protein
LSLWQNTHFAWFHSSIVADFQAGLTELPFRGSEVRRPAALARTKPATGPPNAGIAALAIGYVGLSSGHVLHMTRIDQAYLEATLFQDLEQRNPEDSSGFHRDGFDPVVL